MDKTPKTPAGWSAAEENGKASTSDSSPRFKALKGCATLPPVLEKGPPPSPTTLMANQRLRKSFERVKAQVDLDLLHFRKDVAAVLQQDDSQPQDVLESLMDIVDLCLEDDLETFKAGVQSIVDGLEELRGRCSDKRQRAYITRLLFIITRCSRLALTEDLSSHGNRSSLYMTQPRRRRKHPERQLSDIPRSSHGLKEPRASSGLARSMTIPPGEAMYAESPKLPSLLPPAPVAGTPAVQHPARLSVDIAAADAAALTASCGTRSDFRRSPLGRTVVTALEARLDRVAQQRSANEAMNTPRAPAASSSSPSTHLSPSPAKSKGVFAGLRHLRQRMHAAAPSSKAGTGGSDDLPSSPFLPTAPAAMLGDPANHPAVHFRSPAKPALQSPESGAPSGGSPLVLARGSTPERGSGRLRSHTYPQPQHLRQHLRSPTPQQAHSPDFLEHVWASEDRQSGSPSRMARRQAAEGAVPQQRGCGSPDSVSSGTQHDLDGFHVVCRICERVVASEAVEPHSRICARLDRAINADHGLSERLSALGCCLAEASAEAGPGSGLDELRGVCEAAARLQADGPSTGVAQCEDLLAAAKSSTQRAAVQQNILLEAFAQRAEDLIQLKVGELRGGAAAERSAASGSSSSTHQGHHTNVTIEDFEVLKPISRGAFGRVYLARKRATGDLYAIKVMRKRDLIRKNLVENACFEKEIMCSANNPFIVRSYYSFTSRDNLYIVMEYISGGDTASLLRNMGALDEDVARQYIAETILALDWCHQQGIIHRDVKPDNLLISANGHIKATDFGLSCVGIIDRADDLVNVMNMMESDSGQSTPRSISTSAASSPLRFASFDGQGAVGRMRLSDDGQLRARSRTSDTGSASGDPGRLREALSAAASPGKLGAEAILAAPIVERRRAVGTPDYLAPELLLGTGHGSEVDWWSVGVVLFEFVTGLPPFNADSPEEIFDNILNRRIEWPESGMSAESQDLIDRLLQPDFEQRLGHYGSAEVKAHPWFAGLDWDNLAQTKAAFVPHLDSDTDTTYFAPKPVSLRSMTLDISGSRALSLMSLSPRAEESTTSSHSTITMPGVAPPSPLHAETQLALQNMMCTSHGMDAVQHEQGANGQDFGQTLSKGSASSEDIAWSANGDPGGSGGGQGADINAALSAEQFLNFSFKNLELLGERNREMAETLDGLRTEFGKRDPYE